MDHLIMSRKKKKKLVLILYMMTNVVNMLMFFSLLYGMAVALMHYRKRPTKARRTHKDARHLYGKPFLHPNALGEFFGKDHAIGLSADTFADVVKELDQEEGHNDDGDDMIGAAGLEDIDVSVAQPLTSIPSGVGGSTQLCRKRVRQVDSMAISSEKMATIIKTFVQEMVPLFGMIAGALQHEKEIAKKTSKVVEELLKIDGLSTDDLMKAAEILTAERSKTILFFSMPDNLKRKYVEKLCGN